MNNRIYVCHTFYHVYITYLRELELRSKDPEDRDATLVLSKMSNNFEGLFERIEAQKFFTKVLWFDEKRETFFKELDKYKVDRGNIVINMFYRIRFERKFAKCQEPYIPVDFKQYKKIYVYCDTDPIGVYLNMKHIKYYAMEDGLDCLATKDEARVTNAGHFGMKAFLAKLNLIFICNGYSKYCINMEVNDKSVLLFDKPHYIEVPRKPMYDRLTAEDKKILLEAFVDNREEIEARIKESSCGKKAYLILSDPLCDLDTRKRIMDDIIRDYCDPEGIIFIKPHPRDVLDYKALYPELPQFSGRIPMEVLNLFEGIHFDTAISVYTELKQLTFVDNIIRLGHDFMDNYEELEKHRYKM